VGQRPSACACGANSGRQLVDRHVLEQVTGGAGVQRARHQVLFREARQGDDTRIGTAFEDQARGSCAIHLGHHQVHEHDVGLQRARKADSFAAVCGLTRKLEIVEELQKSGQSTADDGVIVDDQHPYHARGLVSWSQSGMGRTARTQGRHRGSVSFGLRAARARTSWLVDYRAPLRRGYP
jgi:hypothetical protein